MKDLYNTSVLGTKTCTRIIVIAEDLLKLFPKGMKHSSIRQMKTIIKEHNKVLNARWGIKGKGRVTRIKNLLKFSAMESRNKI